MSSQSEIAARNRRFYHLTFWVLVQLIGCLVWHIAQTDLSQTHNLMNRPFVAPQWHAGKLGEAFANQVLNTGSCSFYSFSRLNVRFPDKLESWHSIQTDIILPERSFLLFLFKRTDDSGFADGFRIGRSEAYPSAYITYEHEKACSVKPFDTSIRTIHEQVLVTVSRHDDTITVCVNGQKLGEFQADHFSTLDRFSCVAGPTGLVMHDLIVSGVSFTKEPISFTENFSYSVSAADILRYWSTMAIRGLACIGIIFLVFMLTGQHRVLLNKHLIVLGTLSWVSWGLELVTQHVLVLLTCILFQFFLCWHYLRSSRRYSPQGSEIRHQQRIKPAWSGLGLWSITLATIALIILILWLKPAPEKNDLLSQVVSKVVSEHDNRVFLGDKVQLARRVSDFTWTSTIRMGKNTLLEFVFRKSIGERSKDIKWYSLTISSDPRYPSGMYLTQNNYQRLLVPLTFDFEEDADYKVSILALGNAISASIYCGKQAVVKSIQVRAVVNGPGEAAIVPINDMVRVISTEFHSIHSLLGRQDIVHDFLYPGLFLTILLLFMHTRWKKRTEYHASWQRTLGHVFSLLPFWACTIFTLFYPDAILAFLFIAGGTAFLLQSLLIMVGEGQRKFISWAETLILLLCLEIIMHFPPMSTTFPENPVQHGIPEDLYWYKAVSARRWNPYIEHQLFRDRRYTTRRQRIQNPDRVRMLCLGSSSTAGGYPGYLEQSLKQVGIDNIEVIDCGIPGTTTTHLANFYTNLLFRFQPDIVTICLVRNDMKFLAILPAQQIFELETSKQGSKFRQSLMYSKLNKIMLYRLFRSSVLTLFQGNLSKKLLTLLNHSQTMTLQQALDLHAANIEHIIEKALKLNQRPVLLMEPFHVSDGFDTLPEERKTETIKLYQRLAERYNIPLLDLEQIVLQHRDDLIFIDDVHHNEHGKKIIADALANSVKDIITTKRTTRQKCAPDKTRNDDFVDISL